MPKRKRYLDNGGKPDRDVVYKSLTGKVFNSFEEAAKDNYNALNRKGDYSDKDIQHTVQRGDTLFEIAKKYNTDLATLERLNPNINPNLIYPGDNINVGKQQAEGLYNIRKEWEKEKDLNTDNIKAIQGVKHSDNYVIIDKLNSKLTVFDKDNNPIFTTNNISTGKSGNDYNTITYVDEKGIIRSGKGNESTPAGITKITGTGIYHGIPSFTRGRLQGDNSVEDIASSLHFGTTKNKKASNGCVRLDENTLNALSGLISKGTDVYTLPEKRGSRFQVKDGKLNFIADNPYGNKEGKEKYWDDYNVYTNKSYSPLVIVDKNNSSNETYSKNRKDYINAIVNSKERLQKKFNLDSDTYNKIANLALGIAEQETKFGTAKSYKGKKAIRSLLGDNITDSLINPLGRAIRQLKSGRLPHNVLGSASRGLSQIKLSGDNSNMQKIYESLGIDENNIDSVDKSAIATIARLADMYNNEIRGRRFVGQNETVIDPYDALMYKWMGRNSELSNNTATPEQNNYINNVKRYAKGFNLYSIRAKNGGRISLRNGGRLQLGGGGKSRYWVDDASILPELLVTPKGNSIVRDEAGNPALTVGAIRDINPNATIYERVNRELKDNQYNTELPQWIVDMNADRYANAVSPGIGDLVTAGLKPLDATMPSRWIGLLDSDNNRGLLHLFDEDNRGFFIGNDPTKPFSKRYAEEHPLWATAGNLSGDIFSIPIFRATKSAIGMGYNVVKPTIGKVTTTLQNNYPALFDPYTSWDATLGYHGDNIFNRAIGTIARRHGLTPKAEIPEFHRRLAITKPEAFRLTDDGKFIMSSGRTGEGHEGIVNFATSEAARSHNKHKYLSGIDDFIVHPKAFEGVDFKSIQPSDTFFEMPSSNTEFAVEPKYVTFVSGEPEALDYARSIGMKTLSSPRLRALEADKPIFSGLLNRMYNWKGAHSENARSIGNEIQRLTSMRGAPTIGDYAYFENATGLNSGVVPPSLWTGDNGEVLFGRVSKVRGVPIFNNVVYDPATPIESIYREAKIGERPWSDYYEALRKMPSARQQLNIYNNRTPTTP